MVNGENKGRLLTQSEEQRRFMLEQRDLSNKLLLPALPMMKAGTTVLHGNTKTMNEEEARLEAARIAATDK